MPDKWHVRYPDGTEVIVDTEEEVERLLAEAPLGTGVGLALNVETGIKRDDD